jgi:hypothetical protein
MSKKRKDHDSCGDPVGADGVYQNRLWLKQMRDPVGVDGIPAGPHLQRKGYKKKTKAFESCLSNKKENSWI